MGILGGNQNQPLEVWTVWNMNMLRLLRICYPSLGFPEHFENIVEICGGDAMGFDWGIIMGYYEYLWMIWWLGVSENGDEINTIW